MGQNRVKINEKGIGMLILFLKFQNPQKMPVVFVGMDYLYKPCLSEGSKFYANELHL